MKYGIVIPCYNESERLPFSKFSQFIETHPNHVICFVNDGSQDDTLLKLLAFKLEAGRQVVVYDMPKNSGKAEAVRSGMNRLLEIEGIKQIGFLDADLATGFDDYLRLERKLERDELAMIFGSRKLNESDEIDRNVVRATLSWIIGLMIKMILRLPIKDTQCGAKIFNKDTASFLFQKSFKTKWLFDVEIFLRMKRRFKEHTMKMVSEVPLRSWIDVEGSKLKTRDAIQIPVMLLRIAFSDTKVRLLNNDQYTLKKAA